ncbi:HEAT-like repeat containing protein [Desulfocurvibacter africanus PCS]|uniref:HEAT-like repeat containing protein n=1 Tax=Desulfocurvibacter africanus PCS TaxID=1262666 RepID=M5PPS8_DESAF|nr:DVU0298 family protein [Desulfocurvibacter africanus]EMG35960.1 HEAT-like repeat containing protein [Desulfocurvibacter africanus PCS]
MARFRELKAGLVQALTSDDWSKQVESLAGERPGDLIGPLFQMLLHRDELVRWRAVEAFGLIVSSLARRDMEAARVVMRQMMWRLNEESGNIGWGVAEAMGAILAGHEGLAREYHSILVSYVREAGGDICHGNYLDNAALRRGVLWGLGRLAQTRPELARKALPDLLLVLDPSRGVEGKTAAEAVECHDAVARGLACWVLGLLAESDGSLGPDVRNAVTAQLEDQTGLELFQDGRLIRTTVGDLSKEALKHLA